MPQPDKSLRSRKIALVLAVLVLLVVAQRFGVFGHFDSPTEVKLALLELGGWGQLAFVVAYTLLQPFGVPGTVFIWAAPLIWPWPVAFALSMVGTMAASLVGFSFARFVARDWVAAKIPPRLERYADALARRAFSTVFVLRLVLWMPPWLHAFFGVSKVPFWTHFWASLAGYALPLFLVSYYGKQVFDTLLEVGPTIWLFLVAAGLLIALSLWLYRRRAGRQRSARSISDAAVPAASAGRHRPAPRAG